MFCPFEAPKIPGPCFVLLRRAAYQPTWEDLLSDNGKPLPGGKVCGHLSLSRSEPNNSISLESHPVDGGLTPSLPPQLKPSHTPQQCRADTKH